MTDVPVYQAQQQPVEMPRIGLQPTPIPEFPNQVGGAVMQFGQAANEFAVKLEQAKTAASATTALTGYLVNLDKEKTTRVADQDWQNSPKTFQENAAKLQEDALSGLNLDAQTLATTRLHMAHATITAGDQVQKAALHRGSDAFVANIEAQGQYNQNDAASAGSPIARQAAIDRQLAIIETGRSAGFIHETQAVHFKQKFQNGLEHAEAFRMLSTDPMSAIAALSDPNKFTSLTPMQKATYIEHAREKIDKDATERARGVVAGSPETASLVAGQFVDSSHIDKLFDRRLIPAESSGQNLAPNSRGAFGPAQVTPAFVRDYIGKLPPADQAKLGDVKALSDQELTDKLMADPKLSTDIGRAGFHALVERYGGNPVLALAAYNAGPGRADAWKAAAEKQFGRSPTPAQIMSVVDIPETQNYLAKIYGSAGARADAFGVSPAGRFHLGSVLGSELQTQETRAQHLINQIASVSAATDEVAKLVERGIDVGGDRIAAFRSAQQQAAAGGNVEAARRLHELDFALTVKPQVDRLYRLPFPMVNAMVDAADAQARTPGANPGPEDVKSLDVLRKTRDAINKARMSDPTSLIVRAGLDKYVAVDTAADPADPNFRGALQQRGAQAVMSQRLYGGKALAFTPDEVTSLKERYSQSPPADQFKLIKAMADSLPDDAYRETVTAVLGNDRGAEIVGRFAKDRPELAQEMLQGAQLLKTKDVGENQKLVRPIIAQQIKGLLYPSADQHDAVIKAAEYLDVARRNAAGKLYDNTDTSAASKAVEDVTGALTSRGGVQVAAPPGMKAGTFNSLLDTLTAGDIGASGGALDRTGKEVPAAQVSRYGVLRQTAPGSPRYWVGTADPASRDNFQPYFTAGELPGPLIFDMRQLAARVDPARRGREVMPIEARARADYARQ